MHFDVRNVVAGVLAAALILCCSCEKHRVAEDPEARRELGSVAASSEENPSATEESSAAAPSATGSPTPAEFFPESSPSPH